MCPTDRSPSRPAPARPDTRGRSQRGQATTEYALVLLGVAAIALLLGAWAVHSGKIAALFDEVIGQLISNARSRP